MGKWEHLTKMIPALSAWIVLLTGTGIFFAFPCRYLMSVYTVGIPVLQSIITLFVMWNFAMATFVNPGVIPKTFPDDFKVDDERRPAYKDIEINGAKVRLKWCVTCHFYRPPRCVHCGICDNCIERFDHHCPWMNNCIGGRNYRYFFLFLLWLSIHMISILCLCAFYMKDHFSNLKELTTIMTIAIMGLIVILLIPIIGLTGFHMTLIIKGKTTNEQITGKFTHLKNPFTNGCCNNIKNSLCSHPLPEYKQRKSRYTCDDQHRSQNVSEQQKEKHSSSSEKTSSVHFKYKDKQEYMLPRQSLSEDCEDVPPTYSNRGNLHLRLSESVYTKPVSTCKNKGSRALTPPVPIRFDCSRRSLPPHNRLHAPSPHYVVAQSVHAPSFNRDTSKIGVCTSGQPSNSTLYYTHYPNQSLVKYDYGTSTGDVCGPTSNFYSQLYKRSGKDGLSYITSDVANGGKSVTNDTCCLGNQTVDKLQEIANRTMIGGQCTEVSVLEAFPKGCGSFHNSPNKEHQDSHLLLNAQTPQQLFVDCQQTSSNHSCQSSVSGEFARTQGNRPLSFVRAIEMSESLEWRDNDQPGSVVSPPRAGMQQQLTPNFNLAPSLCVVPDQKTKQTDHEVSYEISV